MSNDPMLPPGTFYPNDEETDSFFNEIHFGLMQQAGEPSLWKLSGVPSYHAYRFYWGGGLRLLGPVVIRLIVQPDGSGIVNIKTWNSVQIGFHPGSSYPNYEKQLVTDYAKSINKRSLKKFLRQLEKVRFWDLPTQDKHLGNDGETWNLEGAKDGNFHFVTRWVPQNKDFIETGLLLLRICRLPNKWQPALKNRDHQWIRVWLCIVDLFLIPRIFWYRLKKRWRKTLP
jgi:hypothetical protein